MSIWPGNTARRLMSATALVAALALVYFVLVRRAAFHWDPPTRELVLGIVVIGVLAGLAMRTWWAVLLAPAAIVAGAVPAVLAETGDWAAWAAYLQSQFRDGLDAPLRRLLVEAAIYVGGPAALSAAVGVLLVRPRHRRGVRR